MFAEKRSKSTKTNVEFPVNTPLLVLSIYKRVIFPSVTSHLVIWRGSVGFGLDLVVTQRKEG